MKKTLLSVALILALSLGGVVAMAALPKNSELIEEFGNSVTWDDDDDKIWVNFISFEYDEPTSAGIDAISPDLANMIEALSKDAVSGEVVKVSMIVADEVDWNLSLLSFGLLVSQDVLSGDLEEIELVVFGYPADYPVGLKAMENYEGKDGGDLFAAEAAFEDGNLLIALNTLVEIVSGDADLNNEIGPVDFRIVSVVNDDENYELDNFFDNLKTILTASAAGRFVEPSGIVEDEKIIKEVFVQSEVLGEKYFLNITNSLVTMVEEFEGWVDPSYKGDATVYQILAHQNGKASMFNSTSKPIAVIQINKEIVDPRDFEYKTGTYTIREIGPGKSLNFGGGGGGGGCSATGFAPLAVLALLGMAIGKRK